MKQLLISKKIILTIVVISLVLINYDIIVMNLESNLFGVVFSIGLFVFGGRRTNLNINYPLFGIILILEFISYRLQTKSIHFLAMALFFCLIYYNITQKFSFIAFIMLLLFSPLFNISFEYLTTEIKQQLCSNVYIVLKNFIPIRKIEGVNFYIDNAKVSIDTACMGLSMFKTGLLCGALLLTLEEKKHQKYFNIFQIFLFCLIVITLNIISNYFRIITLILFSCTQENTLHHSIGILCFIFYQIIPMLFIVKLFIPKREETLTPKKLNPLRFIPFGTIIILATSLEIKKTQEFNLLKDINSKYQINKGFWVNNEVFKILTSEKLTYIKTPGHNPLICWTGSGYKIIKSSKIKSQNEDIWLVKMEKDNVQYNSYWWYECDSKKYTSLSEVLFIKLFYNKPVRLINETSKS